MSLRLAFMGAQEFELCICSVLAAVPGLRQKANWMQGVMIAADSTQQPGPAWSA